MRELALIRMLWLKNDNPGVQLEVGDEFMELEPIDRATLLNAALQLCVAAINAIADDNPEDADEIMECLGAMSIEAMKRVTN